MGLGSQDRWCESIQHKIKKPSAFQLSVSPLLEQKEIVRRVESLFAKADAISAQHEILKEQIDDLPQAVLAKAFRGRDVDQ